MNIHDTLGRLVVPPTGKGREVRGQWCVLRLQMDQAAGDTLNVGVIFVPEQGQRTWRLLKSFGGFRCLYGAEGAASAAFAVDQAQAVLAKGEELPTGWVVSTGPWLYTQGRNINQVVDTLFERVVPIARHEVSDEERLDQDDHRLSTGRLRKRVRDIIRKRYNAREAPGFWRDNPVQVSTSDGLPVSLDLQIWVETGTAVGVMAAITSAWYTSKFYRSSYLNGSYRALAEARQVIRGKRPVAGMFVLRPMNGQPRFTESQLETIDNEIDELHWLLKRQDVGMQVFDNEETLAESVLSLT